MFSHNGFIFSPLVDVSSSIREGILGGQVAWNDAASTEWCWEDSGLGSTPVPLGKSAVFLPRVFQLYNGSRPISRGRCADDLNAQKALNFSFFYNVPSTHN